MIKPVLQDDAFLAAVRDASSDRNFFLWWVGQSGFLVKWQGKQLLFDPYLSDSLTRKYADSEKPHDRLTEIVVRPELLEGVQLATSSHNHTDHLDAETLHQLLAVNPELTLILPTANVDFANDRLKSNPPTFLPVDAGETVESHGFSITGILAAHDEIQLDQNGKSHFIGFVAKFGPWTIYHSGDTRWHNRLVPDLLPHPVDVALVPINGYKPERRVAGNLNGTEAACLAKAIEARVAIPHHFEMFAFNTETPEEFEQTAKRLDQPVKVLQAGETWCSDELPVIESNIK
jgi:L-ascorbate metabolism protein UlaG (beta-lactamase superfamily)